MNCREFADFLDRYWDGDLTARENAVFDEHLEECPACVAYLASYRSTVELLRRTAVIPDPAGAPPELIELILRGRM